MGAREERAASRSLPASPCGWAGRKKATSDSPKGAAPPSRRRNKKGGNTNVAKASSCTDSWCCLLRPSVIKKISSPNPFLHTAHTPSPFPASFLISLDTVSLLRPFPPLPDSETHLPFPWPLQKEPLLSTPTPLSARNQKSLRERKRESRKSVEGRQQLEDGRTGGLFL